MWSKIFLSLSLVLFSSSALAQTWEIDPTHARIGFSVRHMMLSNVSGDFGKYQVTVKGNPLQPEKASILATIEVASINTGLPNGTTIFAVPIFSMSQSFPR